MSTTSTLDGEIRFRAPAHLAPRLRKLAAKRYLKYQTLARNVIREFVEREEAKEKRAGGRRKRNGNGD